MIQVVSLQPVKEHSGADTHTAAQGRHVVVAHRAPTPRAGFLAGTVACGGPMPEQSIPERLYTVERTQAGAGIEKQQPIGETHIGAVQEGLYPMGGTSHWSMGTAEEEGRGKTKCYELTASPHSLSLCATWWGRR